MDRSKIVIFVACSFGTLFSSVSNQAPQIQTKNGPVRGIITEFRGIQVLNYRGIPYARPPVGKYRFLPPMKMDAWSTPINGANYGSICIQPFPERANQSEDCLFINVFVPEISYHERKSLPVMVFIHGGYYMKGSGNQDFEPGQSADPRPLVAIHDMVLVSFNYRLGVFGFFYLGNDVADFKSNLGFRDQVFALQWVQENIHSFGGDPSQVTIFGNSAGSESIGLHLMANASKNLFKNAILQSGAPWYGKKQRDQLIKVSQGVVQIFGCSDQAKILSCMQSVDTLKLSNEAFKIFGGNVAFNPFRIIMGDDLLPLTTYQALKSAKFSNDKNLLAGTEAHDVAFVLRLGSPNLSWLEKATYGRAVKEVEYMIVRGPKAKFFIDHYLKPHEKGTSKEIKLAFLRLVDDLMYHCPTYALSSHIANASMGKGVGVYAYIHTQKPNNSFCPNEHPELGPCHTDELYYVFGTPLVRPAGFDRIDDELSIRMMAIWAEFVKTGKAPPQGPVAWPSLATNSGKKYVMDLNSKKIGHMHYEKFEFCVANWNHFLQYHDPYALH